MAYEYKKKNEIEPDAVSDQLKTEEAPAVTPEMQDIPNTDGDSGEYIVTADKLENPPVNWANNSLTPKETENARRAVISRKKTAPSGSVAGADGQAGAGGSTIDDDITGIKYLEHMEIPTDAPQREAYQTHYNMFKDWFPEEEEDLSTEEEAKRIRGGAKVQSIMHLGQAIHAIANLFGTKAGASVQDLPEVKNFPIAEWRKERDAKREKRYERLSKAQQADYQEWMAAQQAFLKRVETAQAYNRRVDEFNANAFNKASNAEKAHANKIDEQNNASSNKIEENKSKPTKSSSSSNSQGGWKAPTRSEMKTSIKNYLKGPRYERDHGLIEGLTDNELQGMYQLIQGGATPDEVYNKLKTRKSSAVAEARSQGSSGSSSGSTTAKPKTNTAPAKKVKKKPYQK